MTTRTERNQTFDSTGALVAEEIVVVDTTIEDNRATTSTKAAQAITSLQGLANSSGELSPLQVSNAVRLLARVLLHLVRLTLDRHEQAD